MTEVEMYKEHIEAMDAYIEIWGDLMEAYLRENANLKKYVEQYVQARLSREQAVIHLAYCAPEGGASHAEG